MRNSHWVQISITLLSLSRTSLAAVCDTGIYAALAPLSTYAPAQSFCSAHYPASTVTVTKRELSTLNRVRVKRATKTSTTTTKPASTTTTTKAASTTTTSKPSSTTTTTTTTTKSASTTKSATTSSVDAKAILLTSLSSVASSIAKTFCSCIQPPKTVTSSSTTVSTTASSTTTSSTPPAVPTRPAGELRASGSCLCCFVSQTGLQAYYAGYPNPTQPFTTTSATTQIQCQNDCDSNPSCLSYVFVIDSNQGTIFCGLYSANNEGFIQGSDTWGGVFFGSGNRDTSSQCLGGSGCNPS